MDSNESMSFFDLWSIVSERSANIDEVTMKNSIKKLPVVLSQGLGYFKTYSKSSCEELANKNESKLEIKFAVRIGKLLNLDSKQALAILKQYIDSYYHGSKDSIENLMKDDRESRLLLGSISNYYFKERLYLLRCFIPVILQSQNKQQKHQKDFKDVLESLSNSFSLLQDQYEDSLKEEAPDFSLRGEDCHPDVAICLSLERIKEQCELLEVFLLYYSQFPMPNDVLLRFMKSFSKYSFGRNHPLFILIGSSAEVFISTMNILQQIIFIEGVDMEFLQESDASEEHRLAKDKKTFEAVDEIVTESSSHSYLSPVTLTWALVRYLLLDKNGGSKTLKLGEKAIELNVWTQIRTMMSTYPFTTESETSQYGRKAVKTFLSCVTHIFHEGTLGNYDELILAVTSVIDHQMKANSSLNIDCSSDQLLLSAAGCVPINIEPMIMLLSCMIDSIESVKQINAFISNLPFYCEYTTSYSRDEVYHLEDEGCWKLLVDKVVQSFDGKFTMTIPRGTIGRLINHQHEGVVQWCHPANGWQILLAQLQNVISHEGPSSNLDLLGMTSITQLILRLTERILTVMKDQPNSEDTACLAVLETIEPIISAAFYALARLTHTPEPPVPIIASIIKCLEVWLLCNPGRHCEYTINRLMKINFLPFPEILMDADLSSNNINIGSFGRILAEHERLVGKYPLTTATISLLETLLQTAIDFDLDDVITRLQSSVELVVKEIFTSFIDWIRNDVDSWESIGCKSLQLFHVILVGRGANKMKKMLVEALIHTNAANVLLKLASIPASFLLDLITNEPFSKRTHKVTSMIRLTFTLLNSLFLLDDVIQNDSHLRGLLSHSPGGGMPSNDNLVFILHGYLYHRQTPYLPRLAVNLLRRISIISPMSLYAVLGAEAKAFRDILLRRLREELSDDKLKISIMELLVVSVQTQPALFELTLNLEPVLEDNIPTGEQKLGDWSCLGAVLDILDSNSQTNMKLDIHLHTACVKLLNSIWTDRRISTIKALQQKSPNKFWNSLLLPLFSENYPRDIALHELLETSAHIINIVALEQFYKVDTNNTEDMFSKMLEQFKAQNRFQHWSKVLLCVSKSLCQTNESGRQRHLMFASAWRSFLMTSQSKKLIANEDVVAIVDDVINAVDFLLDNVEEDKKEMITLLNVLTSLLIDLIYKNLSILDAEQSFIKIVGCLEKSRDQGSYMPQFRNNLFAVTSQFLLVVKDDADVKSTQNLISSTCSLLHQVFGTSLAFTPPLIEAGLLGVQVMEKIYLYFNKEEIIQSWHNQLLKESIINLLMMVQLKLIKNKSNNQFEDKNAKLSISIGWFLARVSRDKSVAMAIKRSHHLSEVFLNLSNCYKNESRLKNKWCEVFHVTLILVLRIVECLRFDFIEEAINFVGIHQERFLECMTALSPGHSSLATSRGSLREVIHTTELLFIIIKNFPRQFKFELSKFYRSIVDKILLTCHSCVAFLLHPAALKEHVQNKKVSANRKRFSSRSQRQRSTSLNITSSKSVQKKISTSDDETQPPEVVAAQRGLVNVLANSLSFLNELSPNICELMMDRATDAEAHPLLLAIHFGTPNIGDDGFPTFGTIMNAASFAYSASRKMKSSDDLVYRDMLRYTADVAILLSISQCLLHLKSPNVSAREKQVLKRELGDEMASCARTELRLQRYYLSNSSPLSSPNTSFTTKSPLKQPASTTPSANPHHRGIPDLLQQFVKHILR